MSNSPAPTTRIGGGRSARATAGLVAVALTGIVWFGLSGADERVPHAPRPVATPTQAAQGIVSVTPRPTAQTRPLRGRFGNGIPLGADAFAAIVIIANRQYPILLSDTAPGVLEGWTRLPFPRDDVAGTLELAQLWSREPGRNFQSLGSWPLPLDPLMPEVRDTGTVLEVDAPPRSGSRHTNRVIQGGFQLVVRAESRLDFGMLFVTVTTPWCPDLPAACEPEPPVRRHISGDDGIFGLPGWPQEVAD